MKSIMKNKKEIPTFEVVGCCLICSHGNPHGGRIYCDTGSGPGLSMYTSEYDYCDRFKLRSCLKKGECD